MLNVAGDVDNVLIPNQIMSCRGQREKLFLGGEQAIKNGFAGLGIRHVVLSCHHHEGGCGEGFGGSLGPAGVGHFQKTP